VNNLTWPFASVGWVTSIIQRAAASQNRINEFLKTKPEFENTNHADFTFKGDIEFRNVSFTYPDTGIKALENVSFKIKKGDTLAIVGRTGSGKSTILQLLLRQYHCDSGEILIDGKNIQSINSDAFRDISGIVPQDVFLFSDTIANNLKFGSKEKVVSEQELIEVTKASHVYNNIMDFPNKFETILGERGVNLSGGQKQRISIARALLRKPQLLLLDDCLSAVDTETEDVILNNIHRNHQERTTIVVSHRISTIRNANDILVVDQGRVIEQGSHEELLIKNGSYAEMHRKQLEKK
jgi:ATP-binding cassette subfamily B protein